ncbi:MAG: ABC transporter permease [Pseudoclavibacter sp.]
MAALATAPATAPTAPAGRAGRAGPGRPAAELRLRTPWWRRRWVLLGAQLGVGVLIIAVWTLAAHFRWLPPELLPSPLAVAISFGELAVTASFWVAFGQTMTAALAGLGLSVLVGVPIGLALGMLPPVERATRVVSDIGRSFPVIALLPVMILILGVTQQMEIMVIFLGVVWTILLQTTYGARRIDPVVRDTVRSYRISVRLRFFKVVLPGAAPFIMTGVRVAASVSILIAIGVEVLGRTPGMGLALANAQVDGAASIALAYVVYAGLLGLTINALLQLLEDRVFVWNARGDNEGGAS